MDFEAILLMALTALSTLADEKATALGQKLGDKLNDAVEGSETELDDFAKARVLNFAKALISELEVEGVDSEEPAPTE